VRAWGGETRWTQICLTVTGTAYIKLAIDLDSDPISGSLSNGSGKLERFTGWIELVEAIEAARSENGEATPGLELGGEQPKL
jgi:hypothetical protein